MSKNEARSAQPFVAGIIGGFIVGALACYFTVSPSIDRLRIAAERALSTETEAAKELNACRLERKPDHSSGGLQVQPAPTAQQFRIDELEAELATVEKENLQLKEQNGLMIRREVAAGRAAIQVAEAASNDGVITVLYDEDPRAAAVQAVLRLAGKSVPMLAVAGARPRWIITGEVRPVVYGDAAGVKYTYMNAEGEQQGPFAPDVVPGSR